MKKLNLFSKNKPRNVNANAIQLESNIILSIWGYWSLMMNQQGRRPVSAFTVYKHLTVLYSE